MNALNQLNPTSMNDIVAALLIAAFLGCFIGSLWALKRWPDPSPNAPWSLRLPDTLIALAPVIFLLFVLNTLFHSAAWAFIFTPAFWLRAPEAAALALLGAPLLLWSLVLALKGRTTMAFTFTVFTLLSTAFIASSSIKKVEIAFTPPRIDYSTIQAVSIVQGAPVPDTHLLLNGFDAGPMPLSATQSTIDSASKTAPVIWSIYAPNTAFKTLLCLSTQPAPERFGLEEKPVQATAQVLYGKQPAWLVYDNDTRDHYNSTNPTSTIWLDRAEPARQHLPLIAWSILHPTTTPDTLPPWWHRAATHPALFWEALSTAAPNHPAIQTWKTRLLQETFNHGKPFTPGNALQVLETAVAAVRPAYLLPADSMEFTAAMAAGDLLTPAQLADWYARQPRPEYAFDPYQSNELPNTRPYSRIVATSRIRLAQHVVASWALAHHDDIHALGELGDLISVDLLLARQFRTPMLLGGPKLQLVAQRMDNFRSSYTGFQCWNPANDQLQPYFRANTALVAFPGVTGEKFRAANASSFWYGLTTPNGIDNIYSRLVTQSIFAPAPPGTRNASAATWSIYRQQTRQSWDSRRDRRPTYSNANPAFEWHFLTQYVQSTNPADYIDAAKRAVSPRFDQSPEDFIEEIGETFDEAVLLPDDLRNTIWRSLVLDIAAQPKSYGLTRPIDKSKLTLTRLNISNNLIQARRFLVQAPFYDPPRNIYFFIREGLPPQVPALLAAQTSPDLRKKSIDLITRMPTPENIAALEKLASDPDPAVSARAKSAQTFITRLQSLPVDKLPKPFSDEACTFFDLPETSQ